MGLKMLSRILIVATAFVLWGGPILAAEVEVLWLGHATVRFTSVEGKVIVVDPFLKKNPKTPDKYRDLKALGKVDLILITHGHRDHIFDLKELADMSGATVVSPYGFALNMVSLGIIKGEKSIGMNKGGTASPIGRGIKVHMVHAEHGSNIDFTMPGLKLEPGAPRALEAGPSVGYVIEFENGFTVYHSGDTAVFSDMALIREFYHPDLAMVCIGGHFTMGPEGAAYALKNFIKPKQVIPIHYGTFPVINRTPAELKELMGKSPIEVLDVEPGQAMRF
jgi:L-ascorbate metabolism protein UlaG (beta-lactamase superfamily)